MGKSHLRFGVAAGAWLLLSGSAPPLELGNGNTSRINATPNAAATGRAVPAPAANDSQAQDKGCDPPRDDRRSDLCAQWKAADGATSAARWAQYSFWVGIAGTIGLLWTLYYTRKAVLAAENAATDADRAIAVATRNADAAAAQVEVSRDTAVRQLRAYVSVEPGGVNAVENGRIRVPLQLHNSGVTPAHAVMIFSRFAIAKDPIDFDPATANHGFLIGAANDATLGPSVKRWVYIYVDADFFELSAEAIRDKKKALIHFGYVSYEDAFGKVRETRFAFYHWGEHLTDDRSMRTRLGNYAN